MNDLINILSSLNESDRNVLIDNMDEAIISEISVGLINNPIAKRALIGGGLSTASGVGSFIVEYKNLKKKWKECEELSDDEEVSCKKRIERELKKYKKEAIKHGLISAALGTAVGGGIGYYLHKKEKNKEDKQETK